MSPLQPHAAAAPPPFPSTSPSSPMLDPCRENPGAGFVLLLCRPYRSPLDVAVAVPTALPVSLTRCVSSSVCSRPTEAARRGRSLLCAEAVLSSSRSCEWAAAVRAVRPPDFCLVVTVRFLLVGWVWTLGCWVLAVMEGGG